jgi:RNase P subunit RPR2
VLLTKSDKMGMYDSVMVSCPKCGKEHEFQSKSGDCLLEVYTLENCPDDVMANVNRHSPCKCDCGTLFQVDIATRKAVVVD